MRPCPARRLHRFLGGWFERAPVLLVPSDALVPERIELEVDLIQLRGDVDRQGNPVAPRLDPIEEAARKPKPDNQARQALPDPS